MSKTFQKLSVIKKTSNFREAVKVVSVPLVAPGDDQVLIKNIYAGVNATDVNVTASRYNPNAELPFDVGLEGLGVIEAVGKNVTTHKVGQNVMTFDVNLGVNPPRAYSEYLYVKPEEVIPIPSLKPEFLGLLIAGLTAAIGLDEVLITLGRIQKGDKVLITASAGGTGHIGIQWAKQKGAYVIGLTSSEDKAKLLKELGTDRVINYKTENLDEVLTKEFPNGVDVVWETIGGQVFETLLNHLVPKGRLIIVGSISGYKSERITSPTIENLNFKVGSKTLSGFCLPDYKDLYAKYLKQLIGDVVNNKLRVVLDLGQNTSEGEFTGIDSVVRGVE
ncbi:unnamed protein product, partial [Oppiella nova]